MEFMAGKHRSKRRLKKSANSKRVSRPARRRRAARIVSLVPAQAVREGRLAETPEVPRDEEAMVTAATRERSSYDGDTAIKLYLREIGQVKLLTPQEEIELAARIKKGDKKAREQMIKANLRLVVKIARDYEGIGLPLLDLISEGNIGLMKAVERFDPAKGGKLSTYGSWWIKQSIRHAVRATGREVRHANASGNGQDFRPARGDHSSRPIRPRWRGAENAGGSR